MNDSTVTFFGLATTPFATPTRTPYLDPPRKRAFDRLGQLIERRGFAVVTGPPGSGKTVLIHYLTSSLAENHHQLIYVPFPFLEKNQMLQYLARQMALAPTRGMTNTLGAIQTHLRDIQPINPVIVFDEVEQLEFQTTSMIRLVAHHRPDTAHNTTVILAGADTFIEKMLRLQVHEPLRQRITLYIKLKPIEPEHIRDYIAHHLQEAGARTELFEPAAIQLIGELANGLPRRINNLAEAAIDVAAEKQQQTVTLDHVHEGAEDVLPPTMPQLTP